MKSKGTKLIKMFNFPITLPEFYKPDVEMMDTLKAIVASLKDVEPEAKPLERRKSKQVKWDGQKKKVKEVSKKLRAGIKHQDSRRALNTSVFDCNVKVTPKDDDVDYLPGVEEEQSKEDELQMSQSLDYMDFLSNMDVKPQT